jgi:alpha-beta hydrolase superfamily lysophospholipase
MTPARATTVAALVLLAVAWPSSAAEPRTQAFTVRTADGLSLPARVTRAEGTPRKLLVFINGSTPSDEAGHQAATFDASGQPYRERHDTYARFLEVMPARGYAVATMAKRSYAYAARLPRPSLDDFARDVAALIAELKARSFARDESEMVLVGYSEGSIVASKVLGLLKRPPAGCVLLGSATGAFDFATKTAADWPFASAYRDARGWTDARIQQEFERQRAMWADARGIDEDTFERVWKPDGRRGIAPWESYAVMREIRVYDPVPNLRGAGVPLLVCVGALDTAMPLAQARDTYDRLRAAGFAAVTWRPIPGEAHQYRKFDVFLIMDAWIASGGRTADFTPSEADRAAMARAQALADLQQAVGSLPYGGDVAQAEEVRRQAAELGLDDPKGWFKLGLIMADGRRWEEALAAFRNTLDLGYGAPHAAMTWAGHVCDLQGNRQAAVEWYRQALAAYNGIPVRQDQFGITIDRAWIEMRLAEPFTGLPARQGR